MGDVAQILGISPTNNNDSLDRTTNIVRQSQKKGIVTNRIRTAARSIKSNKRKNEQTVVRFSVDTNGKEVRIDGTELPSIVPTNNPRTFTKRIKHLQQQQQQYQENDDDHELEHEQQENDGTTGNTDGNSSVVIPQQQKQQSGKQQQHQQQQRYGSSKRSLGTSPARPWIYAPFGSSSRTDGLILYHWVRANVEYPDYPYARFDIHLDPIVYTDDEYNLYLDQKKASSTIMTATTTSSSSSSLRNDSTTGKDGIAHDDVTKRKPTSPLSSSSLVGLPSSNSLDTMTAGVSTDSNKSIHQHEHSNAGTATSTSNCTTGNQTNQKIHGQIIWTRAETDALIDLCKRYELRWPVIHDRWIDEVGTNRRVEELQYRYYSVAAILLQSRIAKEAVNEVQAITNSIEQLQHQQQQQQQHDHNNQQQHSSAATTTSSATSGTGTTSIGTMNASMQQQQHIASLLREAAAARTIAFNDPAFQPLMNDYGTGTSNKVFDLDYETKRRKHYESLWNRTKAEEEEEYELRKELKDIDAQIRKLKKVGTHVLTAAGILPNTSTTTISTTTTATDGTNATSRKKQDSSNTSSRRSNAITATTDANAASTKRTKKNSADEKKIITDNADNASGDVGTNQQQILPSSGVTPIPGIPYLQSGRLLMPPTTVSENGHDDTGTDLPTEANTGGVNNSANATQVPVGVINPAMLHRIENVLLYELKVPPFDRLLPTKRVCDVYDTVRQDLLTLFTYQNYCLQMEGSFHSKRMQIQKLQQRMQELQQHHTTEVGGGGGGIGSTTASFMKTMPILDEEAIMGLKPIRSPTPPPPQQQTKPNTSAPQQQAPTASADFAAAAATTIPMTVSMQESKTNSNQGQTMGPSGGATGPTIPLHQYTSMEGAARTVVAPSSYISNASYTPGAIPENTVLVSTSKSASKKRKAAPASSGTGTPLVTPMVMGTVPGATAAAPNLAKKKKTAGSVTKKSKTAMSGNVPEQGSIPEPISGGIANPQLMGNVGYMAPTPLSVGMPSADGTTITPTLPQPGMKKAPSKKTSKAKTVVPVPPTQPQFPPPGAGMPMPSVPPNLTSSIPAHTGGAFDNNTGIVTATAPKKPPTKKTSTKKNVEKASTAVATATTNSMQPSSMIPTIPVPVTIIGTGSTPSTMNNIALGGQPSNVPIPVPQPIVPPPGSFPPNNKGTVVGTVSNIGSVPVPINQPSPLRPPPSTVPIGVMTTSSIPKPIPEKKKVSPKKKSDNP